MTSTASQQNQIPVQKPSVPAATSYASAAGATKKPTPTPLTAAGSNPPPVVVGSSPAQQQQHGKQQQQSSASPVNGRLSITPAMPTVSAVPAIAHGTPTNGHDRKSSVTISANGPNSYIPNGVPVGGGTGASKGTIQFGYKESPAVAHSTPQQSASAPIPIPGNNARIPSPAHSPSPIPQPSAPSGGRPPPMIAPEGGPSMKFGSLGGDGERHMKHLSQGPHGMGPGSPHMRHSSTHSVHDNMGGHGGHGGQGPSRGGYNPSSRGGARGGYNNASNYNPMGYPPQGQYGNRSGQGGRGGMAQYQNRSSMGPYPNSPQPRGSPAMGSAMPNPGTPTMNQSIPVHPPQQGFNQYVPPAFPNQTYPYPPPAFDPRQQGMMGMGFPAYPQMPGIPYMQPGPSPNPGFQQPYAPTPYPPQPAAQPMSRQGSQVSDVRPNSSTGHPPAAPAVQSAAPHPHGTPTKPAVVSSGTLSQDFIRPKKSSRITITNPQGEIVDLSTLNAPASPAPSIQQSKTPPDVSSAPTPPTKPSTPAHVRTDSAAAKTAEQLRNEFKEQVRKQAEAPAETKEVTSEVPAALEKQPAPEHVEEKKPEVATSVEKEKETPTLEESPAPEVETKAEPAPVPTRSDKEEQKSKQADDSKSKEAEQEEPTKAAASEDEEDEVERMIREMEEAEALREKQEAEFLAKKKAEDAEKKRREEADRMKNAAENDRKLREQEREMERLEEERERKRNEQGAKSVAEALAEGKSSADVKAPPGVDDKKEASAPSPNPSAVADKFAGLSIGGSGSAAGSPTATGSLKSGNRSKPAALNLTPLKTNPVEPPQPSAALQSLKSARFLEIIQPSLYPPGINSPNPALNSAVTRKGRSFKYDAGFLLQFQKVFTEQPSLEFGQQVKNLIGDDGSRSASVRTPASSGRQNSRAGPGGFNNPMGSFGAPSKLPPNSTSEQRFALSQRPGGMMNSMGSFARPFPGGPNQMQRTPSSSNMGGIPNSPRQGSRSTRGGSKRDNYNAKAEAQAAKTMPLTQGVEVKPITISATGWKPSSISNKAGAGAGAQQPDGHMDPETVQRKVKAALNKMTPEKFDKLADAILAIAGQSKDEQDGRTLRQVIQLTFEKATDESHWASMYAKFCKRMLETMSPEIRDASIKDKYGNVVSGGALFRKYLLNRCQEEFERGWKVNLPELKGAEGEGDKKADEAAMLSEEYYIAAAAKRRGLGLVQFIGELYKLGMLTDRIMHECVHKLVDYRGVPDEAEIESLSKLLRTVGGNLDDPDKVQGKAAMNAYFERIETMIAMPELPSRLKFMLMDIVDLRKAGWVSKEANKGPKTLEEVRAEAEAQAAQKAAENARSNQRGASGGRPPLGGRGGDGRGLPGYGQPPPNQNTIDVNDLRRLKGSASRSSTQNATFGPSSMFTTRSNSGRRLGASSAFSRTGEDSGASSRTGTPPTRESTSHSNAFSLLATMESENPTSPPSTAASPALSKATPDTSGTAGDRK